jgi:diaminopimelate epimerase
MGHPRFAPQEIPVAIEAEPPLLDVPLEIGGEAITVTCVSMGNPHAVLFVDAPVADYDLATAGPAVEHHELFPARVNFSVARIIGRDRLESRTWERGVGETLACGTGASATMVAAHMRGLAGDQVTLTQPGGALAIEWDGEGDVFLSGPAVEVYTGEWPE